MKSCMVPHFIKKGEHLFIEGIEYVVVAVEKLDSPFYEVELEVYQKRQADETASTPAQ